MSSYTFRRSQTDTLPFQHRPGRQNSIASSNSSSFTSYSGAYPPSRSGTISSATSSSYSQGSLGHRRGISEATNMASSGGYRSEPQRSHSPDHLYKSTRQSLRPLPQVPASLPTATRQSPRQDRTGVLDRYPQEQNEDVYLHNNLPKYPGKELPVRPHLHHAATNPSLSAIATPNLYEMQRSSTGHLRTLSQFAQNTHNEDFLITSNSPSVVGLNDRIQLRRTDSNVGTHRKKATGTHLDFGDRWMDKQRQFLQAYEYLCHIGEAKDWIERIIGKPIPRIVELEEGLRDGVILAEIVQTFHSEQKLRIFRQEKLTFRHSDNISLFFRFLEEVGLPELFRFELIDLYEKKNIPKVIYCIHALSWLLYRVGMVDFRIGNLVGQLHFEHHELEQTQKGLDKSGVTMPSFKGMGESFGAEPEPQPVETEAQRIDRELGENEMMILDLQSQIRGGLLRMRLGNLMGTLWDNEEWLIDLQSRLRGEWARQVIEYRMNMQRFATNLQSALRGYLVRSNMQQKEELWRSTDKTIIKLQSFIRAHRARLDFSTIQTRARRQEHGIRHLQTVIRGTLARRKVFHQYEETRLAEDEVICLQAKIRSNFTRNTIAHLHRGLSSHVQQLCLIQSMIRGANSRENYHALRLALFKQSQHIVSLQSSMRGYLARERKEQIQSGLTQHLGKIVQLQSIARGVLLRHQIGKMLSQLESTLDELVLLQGLTRAMVLRRNIGKILAELDEHESGVVRLQAHARAAIVRFKFAEKQKYYRENMEKVVKVQSIARAKIQGQAYRSLTSGKNPPVGTLKGFVHLLNDSDFDFDEEIEFERMRKTVVQQVRQNELADQYIQQLDIKIALLVKNKITLDEVVKHQKHFGGHVGTLHPNTDMISKDPFDLKALNKTSRTKLEHYQELFFILQTQPQYLSRLFKCIREQGAAEKELERVKHLVMGLYGYAQKRREEYYLVKLIARASKEEVESTPSVQEYLRTNSFCNKLFTAYTKSPRDRKFMRDVLFALIKEHFIDNKGLDLESDPLKIYLSAINNEELRTGQRSRRDPSVPREEAIRDPETRATFIHHMQDLRDITDHFFLCLEDNLQRMPFGVRFISHQISEHLSARFPDEEPGFILQLVGQWIWRQYLQPALIEPEKFGAADRAMTQEQRRNLGEVAKVLSQAASGREFGGDNIYLQPLNTYIRESACRFAEIWQEGEFVLQLSSDSNTNLLIVISIPSAEEHYDIDEFNDLYAKTKPTLYIKMADIFSIHQLLATEVSNICPNQDDLLREILRELGSVKSNETELMGWSSSEISLTLSPKLHNAEDPDAEVKMLLTETKRCVLYIIRVQAGANLLEILVKPISAEDEERWEALVREELQTNGGRRGAYAEASTTVDISTLSYPELKSIAIENVLQLESLGRVSRSNQYQDLLNTIAVDIRTKHRRRVQRQRELDNARNTLTRLHEQAAYLDQQLKTYNDYIEQAMYTLHNKKGKKRFLMPFTKQWEHERELQRSGRAFKFGSYKYSARKLAEKGVLIQWKGYAEEQWDRVDLTISSNEVGIFTIDGSSGNMMIPGASAQVSLDALLQAQFNNSQHLELFDHALRVNLNLFMHLIMKKFYNE